MVFRHDKSYFPCFKTLPKPAILSIPNKKKTTRHLVKTPPCAYRFFGMQHPRKCKGNKLNSPHSLSENAGRNL